MVISWQDPVPRNLFNSTVLILIYLSHYSYIYLVFVQYSNCNRIILFTYSNHISSQKPMGQQVPTGICQCQVFASTHRYTRGYPCQEVIYISMYHIYHRIYLVKLVRLAALSLGSRHLRCQGQAYHSDVRLDETSLDSLHRHWVCQVIVDSLGLPR